MIYLFYHADPAYTDYERRKKIFHEAAWMFLMGDESGAEAQEEAERLGFGGTPELAEQVLKTTWQVLKMKMEAVLAITVQAMAMKIVRH